MQAGLETACRGYPKGVFPNFPYKEIPPQNIIFKLRQRQQVLGTPAEVYRQERSFYQCIVPNHTETYIQIPSGYLRKFTPDGNSLIVFSSDQRSLDVYDYFGAGAGNELYHKRVSTSDLKQNLFDQFFRLRHSVHVSNDLNRECSLFTDDSQFVIVGSSIPLGDGPHPAMYDIFRNSEGISPNFRSPVEDYIIYMIDLRMGMVTDSMTFQYDRIYLSHNQGLSLCKSLLSVLSVQHQTIHLYRVNNGVFAHVQDIGMFCHPDDSLVYSEANFTSNHDDEDLDSMFHHPYHNRWFNSLKHRILCWTLKDAQSRCTPTNKEPLFEYYRTFDKLVALRMWKMQLLSEHQLLLKYANEDVVTLKQSDPSSQPAVFVAYDIQSTEIIAVYDNTSEKLLRIYEQFSDFFRSPVSHPLSRDTSSVSNCPHARDLHLKFKQTITNAKFGGRKEATRRLLGQLPVSSQCLTSSPYLDLALFRYDDKWVSAVERPKPCGDSPVK